MANKTSSEVSDFIEVIKHLDTGSTRDELDALLKEGLQAINDFGGKAKITLSVTFEKAKNMGGVVVLTDDVTHKFPKEDRNKSLMFETQDNRLVTQQQDQERLDLRESETQLVSALAESKNNVKQLKEKK